MTDTFQLWVNKDFCIFYFLRDDMRVIYLLYLIYFLFGQLSADNRPSGKNPVGTVQEPPSKLPGEKRNSSVPPFMIFILI